MCNAEIAANWWIKLILKQYEQSNPSKIVNNCPNFIVCDNTFAEELSRFNEVLIREINERIEHNRYININCLHFPGREMSKILKKAQFPKTYLPLRLGAEMEILGNKSIQVSIGKEDLRPLHQSELILFSFQKADLA